MSFDIRSSSWPGDVGAVPDWVRVICEIGGGSFAPLRSAGLQTGIAAEGRETPIATPRMAQQGNEDGATLPTRLG